MTPDEIPLLAIGLTDDQREILKAYQASSIRKVFEVIGHDALVSLYRQMDAVRDPQEFFVLQGRVTGIRYMLNAPSALMARDKPEPIPQRPDAIELKRASLKPRG